MIISIALPVSTKLIPAPTVSPLNSNYLVEIENISKSVNEIETGAIECIKFQNISEFAVKIKELLNKQPYKITNN